MSSRKILITSMLLALASTAAMSHPGGGPGGPGGPMLALYDANGDGKVTKAEITAGRTAEFTAGDANADGYLSFAELQAVFTKTQSDLYAKLDSDGNAALSEAEFTANHPDQDQAAKIFGLADSNDDAALSLAEFAALRPVFGEAIHAFVRMDGDDDDQISKDEYLAMPAAPGKGGGQGHKQGRGHGGW